MYAAALAAVPVLPARPRRGLGHRQDLLGRDVGVADARGAARGCAPPATPPLRGDGPRRPAAAFVDRPTSSSPRRSTPATSPTRKMAAMSATPPRSPSTDRSSRCPTTSARRCGASSSTGSPRATPGPADADGSRRTCSPACESRRGRPSRRLPSGCRGRALAVHRSALRPGCCWRGPAWPSWWLLAHVGPRRVRRTPAVARRLRHRGAGRREGDYVLATDLTATS